MKKSELVTFLKEEHARIEEVLLTLGEINESSTDTESANNHVRDSFDDALMLFESGQHEQLVKLLKKWSKRKWF